MKKISIFTALIICLTVSTANSGMFDNWTLNGVELRNFKNTSTKQKLSLIVGVASATFTHWLGHVIYLELDGVGWKQDGYKEMIQSNHNEDMFAMSAFFTQLIAGTIVKKYNIGGEYYSTGFQIGNFVEIYSYPALFGFGNPDNDLIEGDLDCENAMPIWLISAGWSAYNLFSD